jgi:hypothetical protein
MAAIIPAVTVPDPAPQIQRYGLFDAVMGPQDLPIHARGGGVTYQTAITDLPDGLEVLCEQTRIDINDPCGDTITATPFAVQSVLRTGTLGITYEEIKSRLLQRLLVGEQAVVESIFCSGLNGATPSLINNTPNAVALTAEGSVVGGIGALESWLGAIYGPAGVIHIPLYLAARVKSLDAIIRDGRTWRTALGTAVVFGNYTGYDKTGNAPAAGTTNLYITGATSVWRTPDSEIFVTPPEGAFVRHLNQWMAVAMREYVVSHNGMLAVVNVDIDGE